MVNEGARILEEGIAARTGDSDVVWLNENALLAALLADGTDIGLARMAAASHGVTRDQLIWTEDAYICSESYKAALTRIIDARQALPIAAAARPRSPPA